MDIDPYTGEQVEVPEYHYPLFGQALRTLEPGWSGKVIMNNLDAVLDTQNRVTELLGDSQPKWEGKDYVNMVKVDAERVVNQIAARVLAELAERSIPGEEISDYLATEMPDCCLVAMPIGKTEMELLDDLKSPLVYSCEANHAGLGALVEMMPNLTSAPYKDKDIEEFVDEISSDTGREVFGYRISGWSAKGCELVKVAHRLGISPADAG